MDQQFVKQTGPDKDHPDSLPGFCVPKELPIIFSTAMVRAVLDGRKTQTRRVINPQPPPCQISPKAIIQHDDGWRYSGCDYKKGVVERCPYGQSGDLLYVRETWRPWLDDKGPKGFTRLIRYMADDALMPVPADKIDWFEARTANDAKGWLNRPSIHLPKWASRIWLKVEGIRVERLQDISKEDAIKEGARSKKFTGQWGVETMWSMESPMPESGRCLSTARMAFANYINQLHGKNLWDENPWVWVVYFSVVSTTGEVPHGK